MAAAVPSCRIIKEVLMELTSEAFVNVESIVALVIFRREMRSRRSSPRAQRLSGRLTRKPSRMRTFRNSVCCKSHSDSRGYRSYRGGLAQLACSGGAGLSSQRVGPLRVATSPADDMPLATNDVANARVFDVVSKLDNAINELVPNHQRYRYRLPCPFVPFVDMNVGPTNTCSKNLNQHVASADFWDRYVFKPEAGSNLTLD